MNLLINPSSFLGLLCLFSFMLINTQNAWAQTQKKPRFGIEGQQAPEWHGQTWIDANGKPANIKLSDYDGKYKVLFTFQSWCPGCHNSGFPTMQKLWKAFKDSDEIAFFAVQTVFEGAWTNTKDKIRQLQKKYRLPIPFGHDTGSTAIPNYPDIMYHYRTGGTPWIVIIDKDNKVIFNGFHVDAEKTIATLKKLIN